LERVMPQCLLARTGIRKPSRVVVGLGFLLGWLLV
jgi:hypothetical protein